MTVKLVCYICRQQFGVAEIKTKIEIVFDFCPKCEKNMCRHFVQQIDGLPFQNRPKLIVPGQGFNPDSLGSPGSPDDNIGEHNQD